jgi:hypothetical protein
LRHRRVDLTLVPMSTVVALRRSRRASARVAAAALALFWSVFFFGLQDFLTPLVEGEEFAAHYLTESGWGLLFLVLVGVPLTALAVRPGTTTALWQVMGCAVAMVVGAALAGSAKHLLIAAGLAASALLLAWLGRARLALPMARPAPVTALLTVLAAVPAVPYAWQMVHSRPADKYSNGFGHYPVLAAFAMGLVLLAALAALVTARHEPSRWIPALTVGSSAAWFGVLSVIWPHRLGSFGTTWGWLAVLWSAAFLAAVAVEGRSGHAGAGHSSVSPRPTRPAA